jgi:hypothetical protein
MEKSSQVRIDEPVADVVPPFPPISMLLGMLGMGSMCCRHFYQFLEISSQVETVDFVNIEMGGPGVLLYVSYTIDTRLN